MQRLSKSSGSAKSANETGTTGFTGHSHSPMRSTSPRASAPAMPIIKPGPDESTPYSISKLAAKKKQKGGGNALMMIAIIHLLLACGLIDLGLFLCVRFVHYDRVWPDSEKKLSISKMQLFHDQIRSIRSLYTPATICIGLLIFFPKTVYLLSIFFAQVSFWRTALVDGAISVLSTAYALVTGFHAYIILGQISVTEIGNRSEILCYAIRGPRERASQALRDRCLLAAYKMFGDHLSLQSMIAILISIISIFNILYFFHQKRENLKKREKKMKNKRAKNSRSRSSGAT